jgi:RNA polymerase sigma-70 factor (ECF subfamily)
VIAPRPLLHCQRVRPPLPGSELLTRVRDGDREARRDLFEAWAPVVLRWCVHIGGPGIDAEDAAHDVLVTAMDRLATLRQADRFDSWMFGITRRVLAAHRRSGWFRRWLPGVLGDVPDSAEGPGAVCERNETVLRVRVVLDGLPTELREVLVLCEIEERPDEDVAAMLELPTGTVKSRLRRARARFNELARRSALAPDTLVTHAGGSHDRA